LGEVDTGALVHPLHHTWWMAWGWSGGLAQEFPTVAQRPCVVPVGEEAGVPETHEAAGEPMQEAAADTCVGVERHGLRPLALTTVPGGTADPPSAASQDAGVRDGHTMGRAADIVQDMRRACACLGVDHPLFGIQLGT